MLEDETHKGDERRERLEARGRRRGKGAREARAEGVIGPRRGRRSPSGGNRGEAANAGLSAHGLHG